MFLRAKRRFKDVKEHRYWRIVENRRTAGRLVQRQVLYLDEINDSQQAAWCKSIGVLDGEHADARQMALFSADREVSELDCEVVQVRLSELSLHPPRQWGGCWLALLLWDRLALDWMRSGPRRWAAAARARALAECVEGAGVSAPAGAGERVAVASAMVRPDGAGGLAG